MLESSTEQAQLDYAPLAIKAKAGDSVAFAEIFNRFYPEIFGFVSNQSQNSDLDIAEVTQVVFVKAAKNILQLKDPGKLRSWIYQIARNSIHDARRKQARDWKLQVALSDEQQPHSVELRNENEESVAEWIDQLDDVARETVTLVYYQGLNHREAGEVMGCAEGTVSWRISEALKTLRAIAEKERNSTHEST